MGMSTVGSLPAVYDRSGQAGSPPSWVELAYERQEIPTFSIEISSDFDFVSRFMLLKLFLLGI
jgi:hypothetical protein